MQWCLVVRLVVGWKPAWPFPDEVGRSVSLRVHPDMQVDVGEFREAAQAAGSAHFLKKTWRAVAPLAVLDKVPLVQLLEATFASPNCKFMHSQLLWGLACKLEERMMLALKRGCDSDANMSVRVVDILSVIDKPQRLCNELFKHVFAGQEHFKRFRSLSLTCDKAQVSGLGLLAGAICAPDGHAALMTVQVLLGTANHAVC